MEEIWKFAGEVAAIGGSSAVIAYAIFHLLGIKSSRTLETKSKKI